MYQPPHTRLQGQRQLCRDLHNRDLKECHQVDHSCSENSKQRLLNQLLIQPTNSHIHNVKRMGKMKLVNRLNQ